MQKRKKWQFFLIIAVIALTIYNILPTVFYYTNPLDAPIDSKKAQQITQDIEKRINQLEDESLNWVKSYATLLNASLKSASIDANNPQNISATFNLEEDANRFRHHVSRAGSLIPFAPSQLMLSDENHESNPKTVHLLRKIPLRLDADASSSYFKFSQKFDDNHQLTDLYREILFDRVAEVAFSTFGPSENAKLIKSVIKAPGQEEHALNLANQINYFVAEFGEDSTLSKRFFRSFTQANAKQNLIENAIHHLNQTKDALKKKRIANKNTDVARLLEKKEMSLAKALAAIKKHKNTFSSGEKPLTKQQIIDQLNQRYAEDKPLKLQFLQYNPFIAQLSVDLTNETLILKPHSEIKRLLTNPQASNKAKQLIINEIARISRLSGEKLQSQNDQLIISLNELTNSTSFLALDLEKIGDQQARQLFSVLEEWNPSHPELKRENFPTMSFEEYEKLPLHQKSLGIVILSPREAKKLISPDEAPRICVILKGVEHIVQKYRENPNAPDAKLFLDDFDQLRKILYRHGYASYSASRYSDIQELQNDFIFENDQYYQTLLQATRENFKAKGSKKFALLEFTNVEQRILTQNKIDTMMHEDLLKVRDDYNTSSVSLDPHVKYDVPKPTHNIFMENIMLSLKKYVRGDERKILHWGLDLSGGKTVTLQLLDKQNQPVKSEIELDQGINELHKRVGKMGVSEVSIHREGSNIVLDFPGSQGLSANDLVKASSMFFHVVNEKFTHRNQLLKEHVQRFLLDVWNEASVLDTKDAFSINQIAYRHLYGDSNDSRNPEPRSESAKVLIENGLRLAHSEFDSESSAFNDSLSKIAIFRGDDYADWNFQPHPLLVVFKNYTLEGSNLTNVRSGYDPQKGNYLSFEVKGASDQKDGASSNPQQDLHTWTLPFSRDRVQGTPNEEYTGGRGWRMAVILNGSVISSPNLDEAVTSSASITGSFSQREVNKLVADLKAGSLSYTPKILSEKNVSPELGSKDRTKGITATIFALVLVILAMVSYYRFAGIVASIAVLFNLLIMWGVLQNLQATLTLAGIAGIILTLGMAVDANVLVFERIKEEYEKTKRIASALNAGYKKAFTAIFDSNVTTIIAALILLNFESGPIKAFAITLIIGIASSMFSALFMTRYFFAGWVEKPQNTELKMSNLVKGSSFDFLKRSKIFIFTSICLMLLGSVTFLKQSSTLVGMDFTGGYALNVEFEERQGFDFRKGVEEALVKAGVPSTHFQVRELNPSNNLRIMLSTQMDSDGMPFFNMPLETKDKKDLAFENIPRIAWTVDAFKAGGLQIKEDMLKSLDSNWTSMSGQMSSSMRNNAMIGLLLSFIAIFVYITIRFEYKFAISALLCLAHDVLLTLSAMSLLNFFGVPMQLDMHAIAAIMTIIGYSLNDTIIIFDRIREDIAYDRKSPLREVVNRALNTTLSRTTITSATTLIVLLALVFLGGSSIFSFALIMTMGVVFGTISSLFIASPLMLYFHKSEEKKYQITETK